jgi:hypothetical protein
MKIKLDLEKLARDIATMAYNASGNVLVGHGPPCVFELSDRFRDVRVGDLVVETTTALMDGRKGPKYHRPALDAVGYLLRITWEPIVFTGDPDFVWDEKVEGRPHPKEECVYIRTLDGREFRWTNASFVSAPTEWPMRNSAKARTVA